MKQTQARWILMAAMTGLVVSGAALGVDSDPTWKTPVQIGPAGAYGFSYHDAADRLLAYDHHGNPGIVLGNGSGGQPWHFWKIPGVGWAAVGPDAVGSDGAYPSLAYDRHERPIFSYIDVADDRLKAAAWDGSAWQITTAATDAGQHSALAIDQYGHAAIAYRKNTGSLNYVEDTDGDGRFDDETPGAVNLNQFIHPSMTFDALNRPMIAAGYTFNNSLTFFVRDKGTWASRTVEADGNTGWHPSLALNPLTGDPAIAYTNTAQSELRYAWWDADTEAWQIEFVDATPSGYCSLAFDPADGRPAISYRGVSGHLKFAWRDDAVWHDQIAVNFANARQSSLAFNDYGTGWPAIAYVDTLGTAWFVEDPPAVPEPATMALVLLGGTILLRRRRRG